MKKYLSVFILAFLITKVVSGETFSQLFGDKLVNSKNQSVSTKQLDGKIIGIYFSAHWCPPCRGFTPKLVEFYNTLKKQKKPFEIVFASSDESEEKMFDYMNETEMPWLALPYGDDHKKALSSKYNVNGIPTLIILNVDAELLTENGRRAVSDGGSSYKEWFSDLKKELINKEKSKKQKADLKSILNKKTKSNSYKCLKVKNGAFLVTSHNGAKTNVFNLYGVEFPFKKYQRKQFAIDCLTFPKTLNNFLPVINKQLNSYKGQTLIIRKKFGKNFWLEDSNGVSINLDVIKKGLALPKTTGTQRQFLTLLKTAKIEAIKNRKGIWNLKPRYNPAEDLYIKCSSDNIRKQIRNRKYKYSSNSSSKSTEKKWENSREIKLDINSLKLKRQIELTIKYQFKKKEFVDENDKEINYYDNTKTKITFTKVKTKKTTIYPTIENKTIIFKAPVITQYKYEYNSSYNSNWDHKHGYGGEYIGSSVEIYSGGKQIFKQGELK